jgi:hypothetical protein
MVYRADTCLPVAQSRRHDGSASEWLRRVQGACTALVRRACGARLMPRRKPSLVLLPVLKQAVQAKPYRGRGEVYRYLRQHHKEITDLLREFDPSWKVVADALVEAGAVGSRGAIPNAKAVPKVWARVCRDVVEELRHAASGLPKRPARQRPPVGWVPPALRAAAPASGVRSSPSVTTSPGEVVPPPGPLFFGPTLKPPYVEQPDDRNAQGVWLGRPDDEPSKAAPGSVEAIREIMNLRSGLMRDGSSIWGRK